MRRNLFLASSILAMIMMSAHSWAVIESLQFESTVQEERYRTLINELRCLVCQNQSLADSNADLASDLRKITYDMVVAGNSDNEIRRYMADRYGDFVLYKPPLTAATLTLWAGPFLILLAVLLVLVVVIRRRNLAPPVPGGDADALERARNLLQEVGDD